MSEPRTPMQQRLMASDTPSQQRDGYTLEGLSRTDMIDLAAGYVSSTVQAMALMMLETDEDRLARNARKPLKGAK